MAKTQDVKAMLQSKNGQTMQATSIAQYIRNEKVKARVEEVLGRKAQQFLASLTALAQQDQLLAVADPQSVLQAALIAASLDLPVNRALGYAWIVPYRDGKTGRYIAQFQLGYKGMVQLALRTGQYRRINALPIHEGELVKWDPLTEELVVDFAARKSENVVGYAAYFELVNGFRKTIYKTRDDIERHRKRFSRASSAWETDYDAMAIKTVLRELLGRWGIMSIEMAQALDADVDEQQARQVIEAEERGELDSSIVADQAQPEGPKAIEDVVLEAPPPADDVPEDIPEDFA